MKAVELTIFKSNRNLSTFETKHPKTDINPKNNFIIKVIKTNCHTLLINFNRTLSKL